MVALGMGLIGGVGVCLLGAFVWGFDPIRMMALVLGSNVLVLFALVLIQQWIPRLPPGTEARRVRTRDYLLRGLFLAVVFGPVLFFFPELRRGRVFLSLLIPLFFSWGFAARVFGPLQDRFVARPKTP